MPRTDVYLKVELEHTEDEPAQRLAAEIARQLQKMYSVRKVEVSNLISHSD